MYRLINNIYLLTLINYLIAIYITKDGKDIEVCDILKKALKDYPSDIRIMRLLGSLAIAGPKSCAKVK